MMASCGGLSPLRVAFHGEVSSLWGAVREADVGLTSTAKMMVVVVLVEELETGQGEEEDSGGIAVRKRRLDLVLRS